MLWAQIRNRFLTPGIKPIALRLYSGDRVKAVRIARQRKQRYESVTIKTAPERGAVFLPSPEEGNILTLLKPETSIQDVTRIPKDLTRERMDAYRLKHLWDQGRAELTNDVVAQLSPRSMGSIVAFIKDLFLLNVMNKADVKIIELVLNRINDLHVKGGPESISRQNINWGLQLRAILEADLSKLVDDPIFCNTTNHLLLACATSKFRQFDVRRRLFGAMTASQKFAIMFSPQFVVHFTSSIELSEFVDIYLEPNNYPLETLRRSNFHNILSILLRKMGLPYKQISRLSFNPDNRMTSEQLSETAKELETHLQKLSANYSFLTDNEMKGLETVRRKIEGIKKSHAGHSCFVIDTLNVVGRRNSLEQIVAGLQSSTEQPSNTVIFLVCRKHQQKYMQNATRGKENVYVFYTEDLSKDDLATIYIALQWGPKSWIVSNDHFDAEIDHMQGKLRKNLRRYLNFHVLRHDTNSVEEPCEFERRAIIANHSSRRVICTEDDEFVYPGKRKFIMYDVKVK